MKRYLVNTLGPSFGLLMGWEALAEKKRAAMILWLFLPIMLWIGWSRRGGTFGDAVDVALIWMALGVIYGIIWICSSIYSLKVLWDQSKGQESSLISDIVELGSLAAFTIMVPGWVVSYIIGLYVGGFGARGPIANSIHWWAYAHIGLMVLLVTMIVLVSICRDRGPKRIGLSALFPLLGVQGIPHLLEKRYAAGLGFLAIGVSCVALLIWTLVSDVVGSPLFLGVVFLIILYAAPLVYLGVWLWSVENMKSHFRTQIDEGGLVDRPEAEFPAGGP